MIAAAAYLLGVLRCLLLIAPAAALLVLAAFLPAGKSGAFGPDWRGWAIEAAVWLLGFKEYFK